MPKFDLIQLGVDPAPYWWEDRGDRYQNYAGGWWPKSREIKVIESAVVDEFEDLDHTKTGLLKPDSDYGWLNPEGEFYGCSYQAHVSLATLILKKSVDKLERAGWMHVTGPQSVLYCYREPTQAQRAWAKEHHHVVDEEWEAMGDWF